MFEFRCPGNVIVRSWRRVLNVVSMVSEVALGAAQILASLLFHCGISVGTASGKKKSH